MNGDRRIGGILEELEVLTGSQSLRDCKMAEEGWEQERQRKLR